MFKIAPLPRSLSAALRDAAHRNESVRRAALADLGRFAQQGEVSAKARLLELLDADPSVEVRAAAALAIADSGDTDSRERLFAAFERGPDLVKEMVLVALGELSEAGDARVLALLTEVEQSSVPRLRFQALVGLHHLQQDLGEALIRASRDQDPQIRQIALQIAEEHYPRLEQTPAPFLQRARACLRDEVAAVRLSAAIFLGKLGEASGAEVIQLFLNDGFSGISLQDEQAAIELCAELSIVAAKPGLLARAFGFWGRGRGSFAWQAKVALARLGDDRATESIVRGLGAWLRDERNMAVAAAGRARLQSAREKLRSMLNQPKIADPETVAAALAEIEGVA